MILPCAPLRIIQNIAKFNMTNQQDGNPKEFDKSQLLCIKAFPKNPSFKPVKARKFQNKNDSKLDLHKNSENHARTDQILSLESRPPTFRVCTCKRTQNTTIKGFRINFLFTSSTSENLSAKIKPRKDSSSIGISKGSESHIKSKSFIGVVLFTNNFCDASLRMDEMYGKEICTIQFRQNVPDSPRDVSLHMFDQPSTIPQKLESKQPEFIDGQWFVDLHSDNAVASIKNSCLCDEKGLAYIVIRKVSKDKLEIKSYHEISDLILFSICISSFLCKE